MNTANKTIEERVIKVFREKLGFPVDALTLEQRQCSLLCDSIGMQARDLTKLYMELKEEFNICLKDLVLQGNFDKFNCIVEYIKQNGDFDDK